MATVALVAKRITAEQRETFLEHIRNGANRKMAAEEVGETASAFRGLCVTEPEFRADYETACLVRGELAEDEAEAYRDLIRTELRRRALNPEEKSTRVLLAEAKTHLPEYEYARRQRFEHHVTQETELPRPLIDLSRYTIAQIDELEALWARMEELVAIGQGRVPNPDLETDGPGVIEASA